MDEQIQQEDIAKSTQSTSRRWKRPLLLGIFCLVVLSAGSGAWVLRSRSPASPPTIFLKQDCPAGRDVSVVTECRGTLDPERNAWEKAYVESEMKLKVAFTGGLGPCWVFDHVEVVEDSQKVMLSLFEGYDPAYARYVRSHPNGSYRLAGCLAIGIPREALVELPSPLAGRVIVDGEGFPRYCAIKSIDGNQEVWLSQGYSQPCGQS